MVLGNGDERKTGGPTRRFDGRLEIHVEVVDIGEGLLRTQAWSSPSGEPPTRNGFPLFIAGVPWTADRGHPAGREKIGGCRAEASKSLPRRLMLNPSFPSKEHF